MSRTILPSLYLPPLSYFAVLVSSQSSVIDLGEHFIKRSLRNRTRIMTAQGVMELTIPVRRANTPCSQMASMEIDNSKRWQHQHWVSILSAYRSSPYFEHYAPYFEPLYRREWNNLTEFNSALMTVIFKLLRVAPTYEVSTEYIASQPTDLDLRAKGSLEQLPHVEEYIQVFSDRQPFEANISILDLLFCEGTNALSILKKCSL